MNHNRNISSNSKKAQKMPAHLDGSMEGTGLATLPLPEVDTSKNLHQEGPTFKRIDTPEQIRKAEGLRIITLEQREKMLAGRKQATRKSYYTGIVQKKCAECCGFIPTEFRDCHAFKDYIGGGCRLAPVRTRKLQSAARKKDLKHAILGECAFCLNDNPLWVCSSPNCALYATEAGPHVAKREGQGADSSNG